MKIKPAKETIGKDSDAESKRRDARFDAKLKAHREKLKAKHDAMIDKATLNLENDPHWNAWCDYNFPRKVKGTRIAPHLRNLDAAIVELIHARQFDEAMPPAILLAPGVKDLGPLPGTEPPDHDEVRALLRIAQATLRRFALLVLDRPPTTPPGLCPWADRRIDGALAILNVDATPRKRGRPPEYAPAELVAFVDRLEKLRSTCGKLDKALKKWKSTRAAVAEWAELRSPQTKATWSREMQKVRARTNSRTPGK